MGTTCATPGHVRLLGKTGAAFTSLRDDWDDEQADVILSAVRRAAVPGATVLIIEAVADEEHLDPVVRTLDVIMLAITGGRERTSAELAQLLASVGLRATATLPIQGALRVVEAVAV